MSKCPKHCTREIDEHLDENGIEINPSSGDLTIKNARELGARNLDSLKVSKVKKSLGDCLDLIPSPYHSVKIQIMDRKGVKTQHCWMLSTYLFVDNSKQCFAFTPQADFPAHI